MASEQSANLCVGALVVRRHGASPQPPLESIGTPLSRSQESGFLLDAVTDPTLPSEAGVVFGSISLSGNLS